MQPRTSQSTGPSNHQARKSNHHHPKPIFFSINQASRKAPNSLNLKRLSSIYCCITLEGLNIFDSLSPVRISPSHPTMYIELLPAKGIRFPKLCRAVPQVRPVTSDNELGLGKDQVVRNPGISRVFLQKHQKLYFKTAMYEKYHSHCFFSILHSNLGFEDQHIK